MILRLFYPGREFLSVSLTGTDCSLECIHCKGVFLEHMVPTPSPERLYETAIELYSKGGIGMLISGGCDEKGRVPFRVFLETIARVKKDTYLILNLHTGVVGREDMDLIRQTGADIISIDIVGSDTVAKKIYGFDVGTKDYLNMLDELADSGLNFVPHVTIGLDSGRPSGEMAAVDMISKFEPSMVVFNGLMRTPGHEAGSLEDAQYFSEVIEYASENLNPNSKIGIGCMRPRGLDINIRMIGEGRISAIAMPSRKLKEALSSKGIAFKESNGCCALASLDQL